MLQYLWRKASKMFTLFLPCLKIAALYRTVPPNNPCILCGFDVEMANTRRKIITNNPKDLVRMSVKTWICGKHNGAKGGGGAPCTKEEAFLILSKKKTLISNLIYSSRKSVLECCKKSISYFSKVIETLRTSHKKSLRQATAVTPQISGSRGQIRKAQ